MFVSALLLNIVAERIRELGIPQDHWLHGTGVEPGAFADPSARLPLDAVDRTIQRAIDLCMDPGLGLTLASRPPAGVYALLYHLISACKTAREAFGAFQRIAGGIVPHAEWRLMERGAQARFTYHTPVPLGATSRFAVELTFGFIHGLGKHFTPTGSARPTRLYLSHARPSYAARYATIFGCPVVFDAVDNAMEYPLEFLDRPQLLANEPLKRALGTKAAALFDAACNSSTVASRVRVHLRCTRDFQNAGADAIARLMAVSERTLRRRLQHEGHSLQGIIDDVRKEIACQLVSKTDKPIEAMAAELGFGERTAFHRAFKRWTGLSPRTYRQQQVAARSECAPGGGVQPESTLLGPAHCGTQRIRQSEFGAVAREAVGL